MVPRPRLAILTALILLAAAARASVLERPDPFPAYYPSAADASAAEAALQAAAGALADGKLDEADHQARQAAHRLPTSAAPIVVLALVAEQRGQVNEAIALHQEALAWNPEEPQALAALERLQAPRYADEVTQYECELFDLINQVRVAQGLTALKPHPVLAEVARAYSACMRDRGFFAHQSPVPGEAAALDRLLKRFEGVPKLLGENISRRWNRPEPALTTDNIARSHAELMMSTSHRYNILRPEAIYVGIGIATNPMGDYWITELFMTPRPAKDSTMIITRGAH